MMSSQELSQEQKKLDPFFDFIPISKMETLYRFE